MSESPEPRFHDPQDAQYDEATPDEERYMAEALMNEDAARLYLLRKQRMKRYPDSESM